MRDADTNSAGAEDESGHEDGRGFEDHFSGHARSYAAFRPTYPDRLFDWLADSCARRELAWDCACGNGQATRSLSRRFRRVVGTDGSLAQLASAERRGSWSAVGAVAEAVPLAARAVDLLCIAQAMHWIDAPRLWREARRVLRPGSIVAFWGYQLLLTSPGVDEILRRFYGEVVGPYWPENRAILESGFAGVPFPFRDLEAPEFEMTADWDLAQLLGYLGTWSASARYRQALGRDPLAEIRPELEGAWGPAERRRRIRWPLRLRAGRNVAEESGSPVAIPGQAPSYPAG